MKAKKTYGINGLLEWHGLVSGNGITMRVDFVNGSVTAYGVSPATFTTKDELTQYIIENSEQYKSGRIRLVRCVEMPEERAVAEVKAEAKAKAEEPAVAPESEVEEEAPAEVEKKTVSVNDPGEAKAYLVEHYGAEPAKLRSIKAIKDCAEKNGVVFEGI